MPSEESEEAAPRLLLRWVGGDNDSRQRPLLCSRAEPRALSAHREEGSPAWLPAGAVPRHWHHSGHCLWLCHTARPPSGSSCLTTPLSLFPDWRAPSWGLRVPFISKRRWNGVTLHAPGPEPTWRTTIKITGSLQQLPCCR